MDLMSMDLMISIPPASPGWYSLRYVMNVKPGL